MTGSLETGLMSSLALYNEWAGTSTPPELSLNRDFTATVLDPGAISSLLQLYAAGTITLQTLLQRLYDGEIVADVEVEAQALTSLPVTPIA